MGARIRAEPPGRDWGCGAAAGGVLVWVVGSVAAAGDRDGDRAVAGGGMRGVGFRGGGEGGEGVGEEVVGLARWGENELFGLDEGTCGGAGGSGRSVAIGDAGRREVWRGVEVFADFAVAAAGQQLSAGVWVWVVGGVGEGAGGDRTPSSPSAAAPSPSASRWTGGCGWSGRRRRRRGWVWDRREWGAGAGGVRRWGHVHGGQEVSTVAGEDGGGQHELEWSGGGGGGALLARGGRDGGVGGGGEDVDWRGGWTDGGGGGLMEGINGYGFTICYIAVCVFLEFG